ncbi:hypothetical protein ABKU14_17445 [Enterobacter roggenkampii]
MSEKEVMNLYRSLMRCRDGFMKGRARSTERHPAQGTSERDRELRECFRNR